MDIPLPKIARTPAAAMPIKPDVLSTKIATTGPCTRRTDLQRHDLGMAAHEAIEVLVDFDPGAASAKHIHPGEEINCVLEASLEYQIEERLPVTPEAGEILFVPAETINAAGNVGTSNAAGLATCVVESRKPLLTWET